MSDDPRPVRPVITELLPDLGEEDYQRLKTSIAQHGVLVPILTWHGEIIDGRHRQRAAEELGVACPTHEVTGSRTAVILQAFMANLERRSLTPKQRALLYLELVREQPELRAQVEQLEAHAAARQEAGVQVEPGGQRGPKVSEQLAQQAGVSPRTMRRAQHLMARAPEVAKDLARGRISEKVALERAAGRGPAKKPARSKFPPTVQALLRKFSDEHPNAPKKDRGYLARIRFMDETKDRLRKVLRLHGVQQQELVANLRLLADWIETGKPF